MSGSTPDITVVIPTRDRWSLLQKTLSTALGQVGVAHEIVVVDDGSSDGTADRVRTMADPRVRLVRNATSFGVAQARNLGIAQARGEWLAFLDDDDLWAPDKLAVQISAGRATNAVMVYGAAVTVEIDGRILQTLRPPPAEDLAEALMPGNVIPAGASNVLARTTHVRQLGGFDPTLDHFADWDMWIRLAQAGPAATCDQVLVAYRLHPGSMLVRNWRPVAEEFGRVAEKHQRMPDRRLSATSGAGLAAWQAWGHRRAGRRLRASALYLSSGIRYRSRGNLARSAGALLGERAMLIAGRARRGDARTPTPDWITRAF